MASRLGKLPKHLGDIEKHIGKNEKWLQKPEKDMQDFLKEFGAWGAKFNKEIKTVELMFEYMEKKLEE